MHGKHMQVGKIWGGKADGRGQTAGGNGLFIVGVSVLHGRLPQLLRLEQG